MSEQGLRNTDRDQWNHFDTRLSTVERDMAAISASMNSMAEGLVRIEHNQREFQKGVHSASRTNWGVVVSAFTAAVAVLVFYTRLTTDPVAASVDQVRENYHRELDLVNEAHKARIESLRDRLNRLEARYEPPTYQP